MFTKNNDPEFKTVLEGVRFKTMAFGLKTHLTEFRLAKGSVIPPHTHPHEQTGYVISGRLVFNIGGETFDAGPGDAWNIAGGVEHAVDVPEDSVVVEVFCPPREDYLKL